MMGKMKEIWSQFKSLPTKKKVIYISIAVVTLIAGLITLLIMGIFLLAFLVVKTGVQ